MQAASWLLKCRQGFGGTDGWMDVKPKESIFKVIITVYLYGLQQLFPDQEWLLKLVFKNVVTLNTYG